MNRAQREALERGFASSSAAARELFARYPPERLRERPPGGGWSAAECVAHLSLTSAATVPLVESAVADLEARQMRNAGTSGLDWLGRMLRWSLEPGRFRSKTPAAFTPQRTEPFTGLLPEFLRWQDRIAAVLARAEGLALGAVKITSPFNDRIRYNPLSALAILETHERRHLAQAERAVMGAGEE